MRQLLKTILLISVLTIFIAGCAEEKSKSGQTNTGQTDTGQQTPTTAEQVFTNFMTEFNAMQAVDIGQLTPDGLYLYSTTANITNTRTDNKDAYFIDLDVTFKEFRGVKLNIYLGVTPDRDAPGVLISANGSSNATFFYT